MEGKITKIITKADTETIAFAKNFSKNIVPGDVLILEGDLGAGKTTFVKGLAEGFKIDSHIKSPTFVLIKEYEGKVSLIHIDMYRIDSSEAEQMGIDDFLYKNNVIVVEWNKSCLLEEEANYKINIRYISEREREIIINYL